jgi:hypothetical protein
MRLSTNISHWVCVFMGLSLVVLGMVLHAPRRAAGLSIHTDHSEAMMCLGKRAVLIVIGLVAVAYGLSRLGF